MSGGGAHACAFSDKMNELSSTRQMSFSGSFNLHSRDGSSREITPSANSSLPLATSRLFLLSPASVSGTRATLLMKPSSELEMAKRLRTGAVTLGELFTFMSSLYFRGKLAYALAFSNTPLGISGAFVITARGGLVSAETLITLERLQEISGGDLDPGDARYRTPLTRDAHFLAERVRGNCQIVLLGSIATSKYVDPLLEVFGEQLLFPAEFVGRGDMSRGGLMLRCVESGQQLTYVSVLGALRHGPKPPKLTPLRRKQPPSAIDVLSDPSATGS
jgi:hypothetical protein